MSTSAREAARQIACLPSTSYCSSPSTSRNAVKEEPKTVLNKDFLDGILRSMVANCAIEDARRMQVIHPIAANAYKHAIRKHEHLRIEFHEPQNFRITGGKQVQLSPPIPNIAVQGTRCSSSSDALALVDSLLSSMTAITRISLAMEDIEQTIFASIMEKIIAAENVKLEVLQCTRRHAVIIPQLIDLIKANASSLRIIGRIGVVEAARSFSDKMHLDRLSMMTFDMGFDDTNSSDIKDEMRTVMSSGATFEHLSYTSFAGFDPTEERMQVFLKKCGVKALRLAMAHGPQIAQRPEGYPVSKVRGITHLEIGEVVEKPAHYNRLVVHEKIYKEVFPNAGHITFFQSW
ncbi:hypothetical protein PFISCL1PPCAC_28352 [Pristionchus fissidentatus]|uniref:Uncharacterized protein n=1 Tax=Pristionchus fissidentatus TaxID=1538716 RepID=A0AAV5UPL1_9BILA|nr:hypothetical protein PFISCL1PPCAC_377 [Pristionchus fissidentatus]GMT37055.1 hypothetical protein PFISCL1PPCAC_28352 [Pristionchus fissidentatus]